MYATYILLVLLVSSSLAYRRTTCADFRCELKQQSDRVSKSWTLAWLVTCCPEIRAQYIRDPDSVSRQIL